MKQIRRRLTYANVMSTIAVFLAIGGATAFAATQLAKNSVGTPQLKKEAVAAGKIKNGAVIQAKLGGGAVGTQQLAKAAVTGEKLAANSVDAGNLTNNAVTATKIAKNAVISEKIAANAVNAEKIAANAVTNTKLAASAVESSKLANGSVVASKLSGIVLRSNSGSIPANSQLNVISGCNAGEVLIDIGYIWAGANAPGLYAENVFHFLNAAVVTASNNTGAARTLEVTAYCLAA